MLYTLALATGWPRDYLRYHLPLTEARRLYHCHLMTSPTVWVVDDAGYQAPEQPREAVEEPVFDLEL